MKLGWSDLIDEHLPADRIASWLAPGSDLVGLRVAPLFANKFGNWLLTMPGGTVVLLDVVRGEARDMAPTFEKFQCAVNTRSWQESFLMSKNVAALHQAGSRQGQVRPT